MKTSTLIAAGAAATALVLLGAWALAPRPLEVELATARVAPFVATIEEDGRTRVRDRYVVSAPLAGHLERVVLREGDPVAEGDVLAVLAPALPAMLDARVRGELASRAAAAQARVQRALALAQSRQAVLAQAHIALERTQALATQGFIAPSRLDSDRLAREAADREREAAVQESRAAAHDLEEARAALAAAEDPARDAAARAFPVRSPVAGRVLRLAQTSEGTVALGAPLLEVGDCGRLEIVAELLTSDAVRAAPGAAVRIERWGGERPLEGRVRRVEPAGFTKVSALGVEEQRVNVVVDITSPRAQWLALGDGFRVGVRIVVTDAPQALQVPVAAVFPHPAHPGFAVMRSDGARARLVEVEVVARNGETAWIRAGLRAGDAVVAYPPVDLADGARIRERRV